MIEEKARSGSGRKPATAAGTASAAVGRSSASSSATKLTRRACAARAGHAFAVAVPLALFALVAAEAVTGLALGAETDALRDLHGASPPALDSAMRLVSTFGRGQPLAAIAAAIVGLLALRRRWRDATLFALAMAGAALNPLLKMLFDRPRPRLWPGAVAFQDSSFPSGHAMSSAAFVAAIVVIAWPTRWRIPAAVASALTLTAVGLSRLVLGAHYPSDVLGGWSFAFAWVAGLLVAEQLLAARLAGRAR